MEDRMEQEIDLSVLWRGIQRRLGWIVGIAALLALAVFVWSRTQPAVYEASSSIIASNTQGVDARIRGEFSRDLCFAAHSEAEFRQSHLEGKQKPFSALPPSTGV